MKSVKISAQLYSSWEMFVEYNRARPENLRLKPSLFWAIFSLRLNFPLHYFSFEVKTIGPSKS